MGNLAIILLVLALALFFLGIFVEAVKFLLWVALVLAILAVISWLFRVIRGNIRK